MSDAASFAAAAMADRDDQDPPFDVEAAADAIERMLDPSADPRRRTAAGDAGAPTGDDAAGLSAVAGEPRLRVRLGAEEHEMSLPELAALYDRLAQPAPSAEADRAWPGPAAAGVSWAHEAQAQQLAAAIPMLEQQLRAFAGVNWQRMAAEDPALYAQARPAAEALAEQLDEAHAAQAHLEAQQANAAGGAAAHAERLGAERDALAAKVPEFADPQRAPHEAAALVGYLRKAGYEPADLDALTDHRHVVMARKAMLYDRLMEGRARVAETVKALPRVQAPGSAPERRERGQERRGALMQRLRRSGRVEDAARLIEDLI